MSRIHGVVGLAFAIVFQMEPKIQNLKINEILHLGKLKKNEMNLTIGLVLAVG